MLRVNEMVTALADSLERGDLRKVQVKSKYGIITQTIIRKVRAVMAVSVMWDIFRTIVFKIAQQEEHREGLEQSCIRDGILKKMKY